MSMSMPIRHRLYADINAQPSRVMYRDLVVVPENEDYDDDEDDLYGASLDEGKQKSCMDTICL
jgi:hypothetical protein